MTDANPMSARRVVIAGGGVAAIETALALRDGPDCGALDLTVLAPGPDLVYRPLAVGEPFGRPLLRRYALDAICADLGATLVHDTLARVDGRERAVITGAGRLLTYDALVVATGAKAEPALPRAFTVFADGDPDGFQWIVREVEEGRTRSIAFVVPPGNGWALPLYELALMTAHRAWSVGVGDVALTLVTPEDAPLAIFQGAGSDAVGRLLGVADVRIETSAYARDYDGRVVKLAPGDRQLAADRVVALPRLAGPRIEGLPNDAEGFVRVDDHGNVAEMDGVYAIGDVTTFPIKQGGLAAQQADVVAGTIARADGARPKASARPHLRAILFTGGDPLYLTATITGGESVASTASRDCPWWPPHKIAARHLAPFLADRPERDGADALPSRETG